MGTTRLNLSRTRRKKDTEEAFKNKHLIIFFLRFSFSLSWKFSHHLVGKYSSFAFLVYVSPTLDKREDEILYSYGLLAKFVSEVMRLDCARNHQLHSLCASPSIIKASFFALYEMTCDFKARINPQVHRTCNLKGVAGF